MPHTPGHTSNTVQVGNGVEDEVSSQASYKIVGTNEPYSGLTVKIGGFEYTTVGGGVEGDRQQVVSMGNGNTLQTQAQNDNPVTRLFTAPSSPRYRRSDNNQLVSVGAKLHQHQDGTIMTEHSMGANDNSVVVNVVSQTSETNNARTQTSNGRMNNGRRTQTRTQTRTRTSGGGMSGGGRSGY